MHMHKRKTAADLNEDIKVGEGEGIKKIRQVLRQPHKIPAYGLSQFSK
jgi:hypothetical protein